LFYLIKHFQEKNGFGPSFSRKYSREGLWEYNFPSLKLKILISKCNLALIKAFNKTINEIKVIYYLSFLPRKLILIFPGLFLPNQTRFGHNSGIHDSRI